VAVLRDRCHKVVNVPEFLQNYLKKKVFERNDPDPRNRYSQDNSGSYPVLFVIIPQETIYQTY